MSLLPAWLRACLEDDGQGLVEYSLIIALVALLLIAAIGGVGTGLTASIESTMARFAAATGGG